MQPISLRGGSEHNLKSVDLDLPPGSLIAITGVSGSGKTSLVFDTLYAEARRRYLVAVSSGRSSDGQHVHVPRFESLEGLVPAVAIDQHRAGRDPRATVATLAGAYDFIRLLFARVGQARCLSCGGLVRVHRIEEVYEKAAGMPEGSRLMVLAPCRLELFADVDALAAWVDRAGYRRVRVDGEQILLDDLDPAILRATSVEIVVDRLVASLDSLRRLRESIDAAIELSEGRIVLSSSKAADELLFSVRPTCEDCSALFKPICPALFSFNSVQGACPECHGIGVCSGMDFARLFNGGHLNMEAAIGSLWRQFGHSDLHRRLVDFCAGYGVDPESAPAEWPRDVAEKIWIGVGGRARFSGLRRWLERLRARAKAAELAWFEERLGDASCPACQGSRLREEARSVEIGGTSITALLALDIAAVASWLARLAIDDLAVSPLVNNLVQRLAAQLETLKQLGLPYLTLDRSVDTLSSGEFQRLRMGQVLGSGLTQILYILDEPSIGLHAHDADRLLVAVGQLRDRGNSVVMVEHDAAFIAGADYVVDLGPGAGEAGGRVVAEGPPSVIELSESLTGRYLRGELRVDDGRGRTPGVGGWLELRGAQGHNLCHVDVAFPLGNLVCITGVSGSGKSSLVRDTLCPILAARLQGGESKPLPYEACDGVEGLQRLVAVDQHPIGRTPRSNAATYTGLLAPIRRLFAEVPLARLRGYGPGHFSFNTTQGGCEECAGSGAAGDIVVGEDSLIPCALCRGRRYRSEVLDVRYHDLSIADVLALDVDRASKIFAVVPDIGRRLELLADVGLGYLPLGQPAPSLSGGEAQRVKLATELGRPQEVHTLYVLDEPTTGLHLEDVRYLVDLLQRLVDRENSVMVVEHHLQLIASADYVIDMGPGGGGAGGRIVVSGTPCQVASCAESLTGRYLCSRHTNGD